MHGSQPLPQQALASGVGGGSGIGSETGGSSADIMKSITWSFARNARFGLHVRDENTPRLTDFAKCQVLVRRGKKADGPADRYLRTDRGFAELFSGS